MPRLDKTGPKGQGPMTGRGVGSCGRMCGMGMCFGRCQGYSRGLGKYFGWNNPQTKDEKIEDLKDYIKSLQEEKEDAEKKLTDLHKSE